MEAPAPAGGGGGDAKVRVIVTGVLSDILRQVEERRERDEILALPMHSEDDSSASVERERDVFVRTVTPLVPLPVPADPIDSDDSSKILVEEEKTLKEEVEEPKVVSLEHAVPPVIGKEEPEAVPSPLEQNEFEEFDVVDARLLVDLEEEVTDLLRSMVARIEADALSSHVVVEEEVHQVDEHVVEEEVEEKPA
eukprot:gene4521-5742_t